MARADDIFGEPIYVYSRADAIKDGSLVDVTSWVRETGIKFPCAMTRGAWQSFVEWDSTRDRDAGWGQSERGRAHDVLWMLLCAIKRGGNGRRVDFKVARIVRSHTRAPKPTEGDLYAVCSAGDSGEPVITIMLPGED